MEFIPIFVRIEYTLLYKNKIKDNILVLIGTNVSLITYCDLSRQPYKDEKRSHFYSVWPSVS